jgi:hypothetical protein
MLVGLTHQVGYQSGGKTFFAQCVVDSNALDDLSFHASAGEYLLIVAQTKYARIVIHIVKAQTVLGEEQLHSFPAEGQGEGHRAYLVFVVHWARFF